MHQIVSLVLGCFLLLAGILHLVAPARVQPLVPEWWPAPRLTVYLSGVAELALGVGLFLPDARSVAGLLAGVMFLGHVGVHLDDFRHVRSATTWFGSRSGMVVRVLANVAYLVVAVYVAVGG